MLSADYNHHSPSQESIEALRSEAKRLEEESESVLIEAEARKKELPTLEAQLDVLRQETQKMNDRLAAKYAKLTEEQAPIDERLKQLRDEGFSVSAKVSHAEVSVPAAALLSHNNE